MHSIDSITFNHKGWVLLERTADTIARGNQAQDPSTLLILNYFRKPPDIPLPLNDIAGLRQMYRANINSQGCGLVSLDIVQVDGFQAIKIVIKVPRQPHGMSYIGNLTIPFAECSYVIRIQAEEIGTTGMREAILSQQLKENWHIDTVNRTMVGWAKDPYDPEGDYVAMPNLAEDERFDQQFPEHPLSIVRSWLNSIERQVSFDDEIYELAPFSPQRKSGLLPFLKSKMPERAGQSRVKVDPHQAEDLARDLFNSGAGSEAIDCLRTAIKAAPRMANLHFSIGMIYLMYGDALRALSAFNQALRIEPQNTNILASRASAFHALGRWQDCVDDCNRVVLANAGNENIFVVRGRAQFELGRPDEALADAEEAVRIIANEHTYSNLASMLARADNFQQAIEVCSRALEVKPVPILYYQRAHLYMQIGRADLASADMEIFQQLQVQER